MRAVVSSRLVSVGKKKEKISPECHRLSLLTSDTLLPRTCLSESTCTSSEHARPPYPCAAITPVRLLTAASTPALHPASLSSCRTVLARYYC